MPKRPEEAATPSHSEALAGGESHALIRPRHVILAVEAGLPGYRRGCKCPECRGANAKRMAVYRAKRRAAEEPPATVEIPASIEAPAKLVLLKDLERGAVSIALDEDLPAVDGSYPFQRTVSAMARVAALILDNADKIDRLDMVSTMSLRILDALKRLEPPRGPSATTPQGPGIEQIVNAIMGHGDDEGDE